MEECLLWGVAKRQQYVSASQAAVGRFLSEQTDSALGHSAGPARLLWNSSLSPPIIVSVHALVSFLPLPCSQGRPNLRRPKGDRCLLETQGICIMGGTYPWLDEISQSGCSP